MDASDLTRFADELFRADIDRIPMDPLTARMPGLTTEQAYAVQIGYLEKKITRGAHVIGKKIGLTSKAIRDALKVDEPDFGCLLDTMAVLDGGTIALSTLIQPRVEGEICFVLDRDLDAPFVTEADVLRSTAFVVPALEIIDSRIRDWKITLADTIADNASSGMFVLGGKKTTLDNLDLRLLGMAVDHNGQLAVTGAGAACFGNPVTSVAWLANKLRSLGIVLRAGEVILSGGLAATVTPKAGDWVTMRMQTLGDVSVRFSA
ncbi:MAG: 2-keto-4-pentenoate hydratase [Ignavibacteria bacterium]|nr:2-keto-4-pentenoate hydratase [Ignavibacteria bacterium]